MLISLHSYISTGLSKIGLFDKKAAKLGLKRISPNDVFVVSFPKSGNTWVRFILANMLEGKKEITLQNINAYIPGIYNFKKEINHTKGRRFIKSHDPFFDSFPKTIYVYRDYRDVLISYYHYTVGHQEFKGTIQEFIRSSNLETPFGRWQEHVKAALAMKQSSPERILFIGYDQLKNKPNETIQKMAKFCNITSARPIEEIIRLSSFEKLKSTEENHGKVFSQSKINFFRSGESEQWKSVFNDEDLRYIMTDDVRLLMDELNLELE